jgi:hypothetical protein
MTKFKKKKSTSCATFVTMVQCLFYDEKGDQKKSNSHLKDDNINLELEIIDGNEIWLVKGSFGYKIAIDLHRMNVTM